MLVNIAPRKWFISSRGLRQLDPLLPFLFTIVVDVLSRFLEKSGEEGVIKGFKVGKEEVQISKSKIYG